MKIAGNEIIYEAWSSEYGLSLSFQTLGTYPTSNGHKSQHRHKQNLFYKIIINSVLLQQNDYFQMGYRKIGFNIIIMLYRNTYYHFKVSKK